MIIFPSSEINLSCVNELARKFLRFLNTDDFTSLDRRIEKYIYRTHKLFD